MVPELNALERLSLVENRKIVACGVVRAEVPVGVRVREPISVGIN